MRDIYNKEFFSHPKLKHLVDFAKYPEPYGLEHTCDWFEVRKLPHDIYAVAEPYHEQNGCFYVVLGSDQALVFDTGLGICDPAPLVRELAADREIIVVNSHFHFDHAGGNHFFGTTCHLHLDECSRRVAEKGLHTPVITEQVRDEAFHFGVPEGFDQASYGTEAFTYEDVTEGEIFNLGGRKLEVFFAPGHSGDGICLIDEKHDLVLAGDTFYLGALYCQFASSDFGYSDPYAYRDTLHRLYSRINDGTKVFCCHNAFEADGKKIGQAAELFDKLIDMLESGESGESQADGGNDNASQLSYGETEDVFELQGDGFSVMYVRT